MNKVNGNAPTETDNHNDEEDDEYEESKFCTLPRSGPNAFTIRQVRIKLNNL